MRKTFCRWQSNDSKAVRTAVVSMKFVMSDRRLMNGSSTDEVGDIGSKVDGWR